MSIRLALAGDVVATRSVQAPNAGVQAVYDLIGKADVAIANFEMALTTHDIPLQKLGNRRADPSVARHLPALGFDVLSIANNHTVDYGWDGLRDTRDALRGMGAQVVGGGRTRQEAWAPAVLEVRGHRIGVIAFTCLTPAGAAATDLRPGLSSIRIEVGYDIDPWYQIEEPGDPAAVRIRTRACPEDVAHATQAIAQLRDQCDFVVATIHWGYGSGEGLAEYQVPLGRQLIDAGADLVHGHHPHAIHAIGFHRQRPIFYSSGAFLAQQFFLPATPAVQKMRSEMSPDGYVASVGLRRGGLADIRLHPTTLGADHLPVLARASALQRIRQRLERLCAMHGAQVEADGESLRVRPLAD